MAAESAVRSPEPLVERALRPFQEFAHTEASGGILLMISAVIALIWANSPWAESYTSIWATHLTVGVGDFLLDKPLVLWINDGLMAIFFFVVGLEIKREILAGELSSPRRAALPIAAAIGGMVVPAALYLAVAAGTEGARGWGIPMATDIAFALGILSLAGRSVPIGLKVFLTALAIVDDMGAVLVIALFYTESIATSYLVIAGVGILVLVIANVVGVRGAIVYALVGIVVWVAFLKSGVHATIAGVLLAMTIPSRTRIDEDEFLEGGRSLLDEFESAGDAGDIEGRHTAVHSLEETCERVQTPLHRLEYGLHPWVAFAIMPIFALANAGVALDAGVGEALASPVFLGIVLGLVLGKQIGVMLFSWIVVRAGIAGLPEGVTWRQIYGAGWLAGVGFTMSLFVTGLAFSDPDLVSEAKMGILAASLVSGIVGYLLLRGKNSPG
jgi:NhaA family Na+:H+ antiporter